MALGRSCRAGRHLIHAIIMKPANYCTGFLFAFLSAFVAVRGLIRFVASHTFNVFAWYRIVFGLIILGSWWLGWINWAS